MNYEGQRVYFSSSWRYKVRLFAISRCFVLNNPIFGLLLLLVHFKVIGADAKEGDFLYIFKMISEPIGTAWVCIVVVLHNVIQLPTDILLLLATDKERVSGERRKCFIKVMIWMTSAALGVIVLSVLTYQTRGRGILALQIAFLAVEVVFLLLVTPFTLELSKPTEEPRADTDGRQE